MNNIYKITIELLRKEQKNIQKINKGCPEYSGQPFSFSTLCKVFNYSNTLLNASCFINQNENLKKSRFIQRKAQPETKSYQPIEKRGIILCRLLVSVVIGVETHPQPLPQEGGERAEGGGQRVEVGEQFLKIVTRYILKWGRIIIPLRWSGVKSRPDYATEIALRWSETILKICS